MDRSYEHEQFRWIDAAFRAGDLAALRAAVDDPDTVPNGPMPLTIGQCLEYAIYHSPLPFIRTRIDDLETPRELAEQMEFQEIVHLLVAWEARLEK